MDFTVAEANRFIDKFELPIGIAGFIYGVTKEDINLAVRQGLWEQWPAEEKAKYILHNLLSRTTGYDPYPQFGKGAGLTLNPTGVINKGLALAIAAYIYKELGLPYSHTVDAIFRPLGSGWALGGFFDPIVTPRTEGYTPTMTPRSGGYWA